MNSIFSITDSWGEGNVKSGVDCAGRVDGRAGVGGTEARERVTGTCTGSARACAHSRTMLALAAGVVSLHPVNERHVVLNTIEETVADLGLRIRGASRMGMR